MKQKEIKFCLTVGVSVFLLYLAIHFWPTVFSFLGAVMSAALPLFIGAGLAYILALPMDFYQRVLFAKCKKRWLLKIKLPLCLVLSVLSVFAVVGLIIGLIVPQLISCVQLILDLLPGAISKLLALLEEHNLLSDDVFNRLSAIDWKSRIGDLINMVTSGVSGVVNMVITTVAGLISGVVTGLLSFIFALYILLSRKQLKRQFSRLFATYLPKTWNGTITYLLSVLNESFHKYIVGQCLEAVILGVLCAAGMLILRLPYAGMISALIAFTALIPIAGAYIGAAVGAFMILTVSPLKALIFLVFLIILQQIEGNFIYPKVVGTSLGLPGFWVLAAVTIGGGMFGVVGMLLGVPFAAALYRILRRDVRAREAKLQPPQEEESKE